MTKAQKFAAGCFFGVPLVCCLGGVLLFIGAGKSAAQRVKHEEAEARKIGMPLEIADIVRKPVPERLNAAPLYREAIALCADNPRKKALNELSAIQNLRDRSERLRRAKSALNALAPVLKLVKDAAKRPHCDFERDWSQGFRLLLPEYRYLRDFAKLLSLEAEQESAVGNWQHGLTSIEAAFRVAEHSGEDPIVIAALVRIASEAVAERSLLRIAEDNWQNVRFLHRAKAMHDKLPALPDYRYIMGGEIVFARVTLKSLDNVSELVELSSGEEDPSGDLGAIDKLAQTPFVRNTFDAKLIEAYRSLWPDLPKNPMEWEQTLKAMSDLDKRVENDKSLENTMNRILMPVFAQAAESSGMMLTRRRLTELTLRVLLLRAERGAFPEALPDWGESRIDPFSGNPLVYTRNRAGFTLYSVGKDRVDNGGKRRTPGSTGAHDEVITFPSSLG